MALSYFPKVKGGIEPAVLALNVLLHVRARWVAFRERRVMAVNLTAALAGRLKYRIVMIVLGAPVVMRCGSLLAVNALPAGAHSPPNMAAPHHEQFHPDIG
jgi:hypothetical protein